jgi:ketosteroid isomerase-like protein
MIAPVRNAASPASAGPSTIEDEVRRAVAAAIEVHRMGFLHLDPEQLASIWDHQHEPLIYVAQEKEEPIRGWTAIHAYLAALPEHLDEVLAKDLDDVQIDVLGDTAIAFFTSRSRVKLKGHRTMNYEPIGHVSMIFRRTSEGWLAIHFHESARSAQAAQVMQTMQALDAKPHHVLPASQSKAQVSAAEATVNVIIAGGDPENMRGAEAAVREAGFGTIATFSEEEALAAIRRTAKPFAVVTGGAFDQAAHDRMAAVAKPKGAIMLKAFLRIHPPNHSAAKAQFAEQVVPALVAARGERSR